MPRSASWRNRRAASCSAGVLTLALATSAAHADPRVVALVNGSSGSLGDARIVGPSGQVYAPVGNNLLRWQRTSRGGVAATVVFAGRHRGQLYAAGRQAPIYVARKGVWYANPLPNRGWTSLSTGGATGAVAVGRQVYTLRANGWRRFGRTRGRVSALWASAADTIYVANTAGRLRRGRTLGKRASWAVLSAPLAGGDHVVAFAGGRPGHLYAITKRGALLHIRGTQVRRVGHGLTVRAAGTAGSAGLVIAGRSARGTAVVAPVLRGKVAKPEAILGLGRSGRIAAVAAGADHTILVVSEAGELFLRDKAGTWQPGKLQDGAAKPTPTRFRGASPARTR